MNPALAGNLCPTSDPRPDSLSAPATFGRLRLRPAETLPGQADQGPGISRRHSVRGDLAGRGRRALSVAECVARLPAEVLDLLVPPVEGDVGQLLLDGGH